MSFMKLKSLRLKKSEKSDEVSVGYRPKPTLNKGTFLLVFGVLLASASFYEGTAYQRNVDGSTVGNVATTSSSLSGNGSNTTKTDSFVRDHILGAVTAVSSTSITVQDENSGQNTTLSITKTTAIEANGESIAATEIQDGDLVIVTKTSSSSTAAATIIVTQGTFGDTNTNNPGSSSNTNDSSTNQSGTTTYQPLESN